MAEPVKARVRRHRATQKAAGLRPVQLWLPDTRRPGFVEECRRQARRVARADRAERRALDFLDLALQDIAGTDRE
ncbi:MAG: antitoxin MazE family protein [Alphaproteobacteria bacterium]|nr:antitoxin MazE family protein [Alphaproteobacteria bacterium]MCW5750657.1 antitoxin MazE family protein [Alphaproteobacteria bacterium]